MSEATSSDNRWVRDVRRLSIVIPLYNEADSLSELTDRLEAVLPTLEFGDFEILLVSDGSTDGTDQLIGGLADADGRYVGVLLSRNFGHQAAIWTGVDRASGDVVAIMDGDLQDPPEVIPELVQALDRGADVAYAIRQQRRESLWKRFAYATFYRLMRLVSSIEVPLDSGDFCCMRRAVVDAMKGLPERPDFVRGLRAWVGFTQVGVPYNRGARTAGRSGYSIRRLVNLAYDGLFAFSELPIRLMQLLGFVASLGAISVSGGYAIWFFLATERFPSGFATIVASIWLLAGIQFLFLGIVGEYVVRALREGRGRPAAIVREVIRRDGRGSADRDTF